MTADSVQSRRLASRIEITKLARELNADERSLGFLSRSSVAEIRDLRAAVTAAMFSKHEDRVTRLASLSRMLPVPLTARIAKLALGPRLSALVAGVMDPREAARLATHLDEEFLTELALSLDPVRVAPIVRALPDSLVLAVGKRLLARGEHLTLGRFAAVVPLSVIEPLVADATPRDLLYTALYAEDQTALEDVVKILPDEMLGKIIRSAAEENAYDAAVVILASLSAESCGRLVAQVGAVEEHQLGTLISAVAENEVWSSVLPGLHLVDQEVLRVTANVPETLNPHVLDDVIRTARDLGLAPTLVQIVLALDDDHVSMLKEVPSLMDPEVQEWILATAGVSRKLIHAVFAEVGLVDA
ncbi:MAG: hypothetical protein ACSLEW_10790 [Nocardioides sp.]